MRFLSNNAWKLLELLPFGLTHSLTQHSPVNFDWRISAPMGYSWQILNVVTSLRIDRHDWFWNVSNTAIKWPTQLLWWFLCVDLHRCPISLIVLRSPCFKWETTWWEWLKMWEMCATTYGISSGNTSAIILMLSVFAFEVGEAASRIFNRAIIHCGRLGNIAWYSISAGVIGISFSTLINGFRAISSSRFIWISDRLVYICWNKFEWASLKCSSHEKNSNVPS